MQEITIKKRRTRKPLILKRYSCADGTTVKDLRSALGLTQNSHVGTDLWQGVPDKEFVTTLEEITICKVRFCVDTFVVTLQHLRNLSVCVVFSQYF